MEAQQHATELGNKYPKVFAFLRQGDIDVTDIDIMRDIKTAEITEADLPLMEQALTENSILMHDGMPFPGDDEKFDALVASSKGLQLLQKFYNFWG